MRFFLALEEALGFGDQVTRTLALPRARSGPVCRIPMAGQGEKLYNRARVTVQTDPAPFTVPPMLEPSLQLLPRELFCYISRPQGLVSRPYVLPATGSLCSGSIDSFSDPLLHSRVRPPSWSSELDLVLGAGPGLCFSCPLGAAPWPVPRKPCSHPGSGSLAQGSGVRMIRRVCVMA